MKKKQSIQGYEFVYIDDKISYFIKLAKPKFIAIILVLTIGLIKHSLIKKNYVKIIFNHHLDKNEIKLVYLLSYSMTSLNSVIIAYKRLEEFAIEKKCNAISAVVVNKKLSEKILNRNGFYFIKKHWFLGSIFKKQLL